MSETEIEKRLKELEDEIIEAVSRFEEKCGLHIIEAKYRGYDRNVAAGNCLSVSSAGAGTESSTPAKSVYQRTRKPQKRKNVKSETFSRKSPTLR